ncbi:hypothetical protein QUB80_30605 [Chlorogloeopsis sp. ULAP01]|uniref:hypothetical protein n=1 Tax=Chlorogloeopsis sp. ULAP01 TaxID=3056483 RepID=UPI0025AA7375|nr:hypothetical protein [Chlorogloeopsis sp. ULAP01]MDM9385012.1 hypothetical protein [Chlorogloeopsis sp. ULAP01]
MKAVLIATIGTRDLIFQISSGTWYNIGDDRMQNGEIIGEQAEVISDLGLHNINFRDLTQYLLDKITIYQERIKPVIIGKLLSEKATDIERIYLIATDQKLEVREREKDTLYAAELIKAWIVNQFNHISVEIISLGQDGTNPSNFEQMFYWWRRTWREKITTKADQSIWLCLKGGVGQASEASRISGLSLYGDRIQFFEFKQNTQANQAGIPSDYSGPFLGNNYLWDRTQQQALKLLARYDYAEVYDLLLPYFQQSSSSFGAVPNLLKAGILWNQRQFEKFLSLARSSMAIPAIHEKFWIAYEQAYLGVVRLQQQNTTEAMLHSHRAIEGVLYLWASQYFPDDLIEESNQYPLIKDSILQKYPTLSTHFNQSQKQISEISLYGRVLRDLVVAAIPATINSNDFYAFWHPAREMRNNLSHRLEGLSERELFTAWGKDVTNSEQWQTRILNCLNLVTGQFFRDLAQASIFNKLHNQVLQAIANKELSPLAIR